MEKKNILIATQTMGIGGCETYVEVLCRQLKKLGYGVSIVAKDGILRENLEKIGVKIHIMDFFQRKEAIKNIEDIEEIIKVDKIDTVYVQPFYPLFEAVVASINQDIPYYIFFHGVSLKGYLDINTSFEALGKWSSMFMKDIALKYVKKFVYVSDEVKNFYESNLQISQGKGILLKNSVELLKSIDEPERVEKFLLLSRLDKDKFDSVKIGIDFFVKLCDRSNDKRNFSLDIVGEGQETEKIKKIIQEYKDYNIKILGATSNPYDTIKQYDALIGMGRTIIEAMSLKKLPILITYDKYIGIVDKNLLTKISYANFSGRNMDEKNIVEDIELIMKSAQDELSEISNGNFNFILENNNIEENIKELLKDMDENYKYGTGVKAETEKYIELVRYINYIEKDLEYQKNMIENCKLDNQVKSEKNILLTKELEDRKIEMENYKTNIKEQSEKNILLTKELENRKIEMENYKANIKEQSEKNILLAKELENKNRDIEINKNIIKKQEDLLNNIYNKRVYKIYRKIKNILQ